MRKIFIIAAALVALCSFAETPVANKIVRGMQGCSGSCTTPDGQNGSYCPTSTSTTTTTSTSAGKSQSSGSSSTTVSAGASASLKGPEFSGGMSNTSNSGTTSSNSSQTTSVTTTVNKTCVPYK